MLNQYRIGYYTFLLIFLVSLFSIGYWIERYQSTLLMAAFSSAFLAYVFLLQERNSPNLLLVVGIIARIVLLTSLPSLSDDVYRFIWDGLLLKNGIHPFSELPSFYLDQSIAGIDSNLFNQLNSPEYFTIYPPLNQFVFWVSVHVSTDWLVSANMMRIVLIAADIGSFLILQKLLNYYHRPTHLAFWYFLNPLIILEFAGNIHFEGLVIFFLLVSIYCYENSRNLKSAVALGLAIGSKLLPLIFLPYFFIKGIKHKNWWIAIAAGTIGLLTMLPLWNDHFLNGMQTSLNLYFRRFEFNASLYYIAREIGWWIYGFNNIRLIGPLMSIFSMIAIFSISILGYLKNWSIPKSLLFILSSYLLFATTVHPWYILPLVGLGILAGYWYPVVWTFVIFLTYLGYSKSGFELPIWIIVIEYLIVIFTFLLDQYRKNSLMSK